MGQRRFLVCFDGTWNSQDKGAKPTNVVKLVRSVTNQDENGVSQVVFYDKGVGTAGGTDAIVGGGLGVGLTANVMDGYRFIANNHEPGDEIYIFGFSRGAYTARSLAGLIGLAGLLAPEHLGGGLREVMAVCRSKDLAGAQKKAAVARLRLTARHPVRIRCVGVWDTVGSLGIPGDLGRRLLGGKYDFHDVQLGSHIDVALHAVAIDEKRGAFAPTLWVSPNGKPATDGQVVEQVWFPGAHSNVGGSYEDSGLSDIAFDWMVRRASALTPLVLADAQAGAVCDSVAAKSIDSRTLLYKSSVLYPYQRIMNREVPTGGGLGNWFRRTFRSLDRRNIPPDGLLTVGEALHISVLERRALSVVPHDCAEGTTCTPEPYRPVNLEAVVAAHSRGRTMPVIGWDGCVIDSSRALWPQSPTADWPRPPATAPAQQPA